MTEYPEYFKVGTRVLTQEGKDNPMNYYHTCDRDIIYEGLRVDMVLAYMAANKKKNSEEYLVRAWADVCVVWIRMIVPFVYCHHTGILILLQKIVMSKRPYVLCMVK
jgi:hypothetical protein